jgi:hypothetical protein
VDVAEEKMPAKNKKSTSHIYHVYGVIMEETPRGRITVTPSLLAIYGPVHNAFDARKSITKRSGRGLEIKTFLGPVKWQQAVRRVPFRAQKSQDLQGPTPSHLLK